METKKHSTTASDQRDIYVSHIYKLLIDNSSSAIFLTKTNGQIIDLNAAAEAMFGYSKEELLQLGRQGILDRTDENLHALLAERKETGKVKGEVTGIDKSGFKFPVEFTSSVFKDDTGEEYTCTIMQDISNRKKVEQEMLLMLNNTEECFVLVDKELLILNFNKQFKTLYKRYFHLSVEKGLSILNFVLPERLQEAKEIYKAALQGEVILRNLSIKNAEGEYGYFKIKYSPSKNEQNVIIGIFITVIDITNETRASFEIERRQEKLEQAEANYREIFENANDAIFIHEIESGKILDLNKKGCELLGKSKTEILTTDPNTFTANTVGYTYDVIRYKLSLAAKGQPQLFEWISRHSDGSLNWVEVSLQKTIIAGSEKILANYRLINDRKNAEEQAELQRKDKEALINSTDDLIWSIDSNYKLIAANNAYLSMLENITAQPYKIGIDVWIEELGESINNKWKAFYQRALAGEKYSVEDEFIHYQTGKQNYELVSFNPIFKDEKVIAVACYSKNITELAENQMAVKATNAELDNILASSQDMICTVASDNTIVRVSAASEIILGYKPEELIGKYIFDFVYDEDKEETKDHVREVMSGQSRSNYYNRYVRKDGSLVYLEWTAKWDEQTNNRYGVARDVTAKVGAENKLKLSEQRFKSLVQDGGEMIAIIDVDANYTYVSPTSYAILGYEPQELDACNAFDFIHPDDKELVHRYFLTLAETKKIILPHFRFKNRDGKWLWIETTLVNLMDEPAINGIVANSRDITERKNIEAALLVTKENYKNLFENSPAPMFIFDFETLQIMDCNIETVIKYGYTKEEFLQLTIKDIRPPEDISMLEAVVKNEETYGQIHKKTWRHQKKNGEIMYMDITGHIIDYDGKRVSIVMLIDVTERLLLEQQSEFEKRDKEALINNTDDLIWSVSVDYKLIAANIPFIISMDAFAGKILKPGDDLLLHEVYNEKVLNEWQSAYAAAFAGNIFKQEFFSPTTDRMPAVWTDVNFNPIFQNGIVIGVACYGRDITEAKKAAEEREATIQILKDKDSKLEKAQQIAKLGYWQRNLITNEVYCSKEIFSIWEIPGTVVPDSNYFVSVIHPADVESCLLSDAFAVENDKELDDEYRIIMPDGSIKWIHEKANLIKNEKGEAIYLAGTAQDITDRKKAEQKIYESNQRYEHVTKATYDAIWEWDVINNTIYRAEGFERSFGFNLSELNKPEAVWENFIHADDRAFANKSIGEAIKSQTDYWSHEYRIIKPNGEEAYVEDRAYILRNEKGEAQRIIGALRDVTDRKYYHDLEILEREVLEKNTQAEKTIEEVINVYIFGIQKLHPGMICSMQQLLNKRLYNLSSPDLPADYLAAIHGVEIGDNQGSCGTAVFLKEKIIVTDISTDVRWKNYTEVAAKAGLKACWSHPILDSKNNIVGTFAIYYKVKKAPTVQEENTITRAANFLHTILESYHRESALQESNLRYLNVTKATFDAIWDWDIATNNVYWGDTYKQLFGKFEDDHLPDTEKVLARLHPDEKDRLVTSIWEVVEGNVENWTFEHRYLKNDNTYAYVLNKALIVRDEKGVALRVFGAMQDITKQKEEEQRLKLMSSVVTSTNDAVLITEAEPLDRPGLRIIFVNDAFCKMTGYSPDELIGKTPKILQGPKTDKLELKRIGEALRRWESCDATVVNYKKNGEEFWINFTLSPVANEKGWYTHWISVERDVTERKNDELQKELLRKIRIIFNEPISIKETLDMVLKDVTLYGDFCFAESWLLTADKKEIKRATYYVGDPGMRSILLESTKIAVQQKGEGLVGTAWQTLKMQRWEPGMAGKNILEENVLIDAGVKKLYALPFLNNAEVIGVIVFGLDKPETSSINFQNLFNTLKTYLGAEIKRKQLEQELSNLFNSAPDIIAVAGLDGYFKKLNPAACDILEYSQEELMARPLVDFVHPDDVNKTIEEIKNLNAGETTFYFENRYITKSGKIKWIAWTCTPSLEEEVIFAVAKNITEKKDLEVVLNKANQLAKIGNWELDVEKKSLYWSDITKEIHETPPGFVPTIENAATAYKDGKSREEMVARIKEAIENGTSWDLEVEIITQKGNERWIRSIGGSEFLNGKCVKLFGSTQDINDRKRAEESIRSSEERRELIMNAALDAIICIDKKGNVTFWNPQAENIFGWKEVEVMGSPLSKIIIPQKYQKGHEDGMTNYNKTGIGPALNVLLQLSALRKNGEEFPIELTVLPIEQDGEKFFCAFVRDITERKLSETRLLELNSNLQKQTLQLEGINKELEQFAYVASHDLQEPLRMVTSFITQLEKKYENILDETGRKYIFYAVDGAKRMRQIILDLLEFSRIGKIDELKESIDLTEIVNEIKILYSSKINEQKATIVYDKLPVITSYKSPVRQVFQNLLSNALKYCKENIPCKIKIATTETDVHWQFAITDNGIGINKDYFDKIFIIFQRLHTKDIYSGTGLGLAVTKKIVENLNGKIWVDSVEGEGSVFYFTIPKNS